MERLIAKVGEASPIQVVLDVGAHVGTDSLPIARAFPHLNVVAIEGTPSLAEKLRELSSSLRNYTVVEAVIDASEREREFNLVGRGQAGLNSLNEFSPGIEHSWKGMPSEPTERIRVRTKRLETVCDEHDIESVDILHVDTQGSDIQVLMSLGDRLELVKAGVIEAGNRRKLYATSVHRDDARALLTSRNFQIFDIRPVDDFGYEQNLFFVDRSIERSLLPDALESVRYRALVWRCFLIAVSTRARKRVQALRVRLALRTRIRRVVAR